MNRLASYTTFSAVTRTKGRLDGAGGNAAANDGSERKVFSAPVISLPKGGGALKGIGEKFAANPVTGTGALTVPIYPSGWF